MAGTPDIHGDVAEKTADDAYTELETPDVHNVADQIRGAREAYREYAGIGDPPSKTELLGWNVYGLCSYSVHTVLIPILFPLIIAQAASSPPEKEPAYNSRGIACSAKMILTFQSLVNHSITVHGWKFSPLQWTAISWVAGALLAAPVLVQSAWHLDHGRHQPLILGGATAVGAFSCILTGLFKTPWIFPLYITTVVTANAVGTAAHTRHLGLMVRASTAHAVGKHHFPRRRAVAGWHSLYATAAGCLGASLIAAFTYHMLRRSDQYTGLWVASIFTGLKWFVGICHAFTENRPGMSPARLRNQTKLAHALAIFKYPHAAGGLAGVFLSSFSSTCIFAGGILHVSGQICIKSAILLLLWLIYFTFPTFSLPLLHPLQQILRADAVRMQLLGFLMSAATSGVGFYFKDGDWRPLHMLLAALLQGTAAGILHAFGRVLVSDCSPPGEEGAFSAWFAWVKTVGTCAGFAVASAHPGDVRAAFGVAFCAVAAGVVVLIFGNISHLGGVEAAGHVTEEGIEEGSPAHGLDVVGEGRGSVYLVSNLVEEEMEERGKTQV